MILLPQQIQAILFHLAFGWLFGLAWSFYNRVFFRFKHSKIRWVSDIVFFLLYFTGMYAGLYGINGGVTQIYLVVIFLTGVWIYLKFYANVFMPAFNGLMKCVKQCAHFLKLAFLRLLRIIDVRTKWKNWRKKHGKKRKRKTKQRRKRKATQEEKRILEVR